MKHPHLTQGVFSRRASMRLCEDGNQWKQDVVDRNKEHGFHYVDKMSNVL